MSKMVRVSILFPILIVSFFAGKVTSVTPPPYRFQLPHNSSHETSDTWRTGKTLARAQFPYPFIATGNRTLDALFEGGNFDQRLLYETKISAANVRHPNAIPNALTKRDEKIKGQSKKKPPLLAQLALRNSSVSAPVPSRGTGKRNVEILTDKTTVSAEGPTVPQFSIRQNHSQLLHFNDSEGNKGQIGTTNSTAQENNKKVSEAKNSRPSVNIVDLLTLRINGYTEPNLEPTILPTAKNQIDHIKVTANAGNSKLEGAEESSSGRSTARGSTSRSRSESENYVVETSKLLKNLLEYVSARIGNSHSRGKNRTSNDLLQNVTWRDEFSKLRLSSDDVLTAIQSPNDTGTMSDDLKTADMISLLTDSVSSLSSCLVNGNASSSSNNDITVCSQFAVIRMFDEVLKSDRIDVTKGVAFIKRVEDHEDDSSVADRLELERAVLFHDWLTAVIDRVGKFFRLYSLDLSLMELELNSEGRGHHHYRRVFPIIVTTYMIMSTFLIPLGFQFMAMLGGKALVLSKLAFLWSMMGSSRRVFPYPYPETGHHEFPPPPPAYYRAAAHRRDTLH